MHYDKISFSFGKNWQDFVEQYWTPERIAIAKQHVVDFLEVSDLRGKYFLDIGCGSGLSSFAAYKLGAEKIVSFDIDPYSVSTTQKLKEMAGNPPRWEVLQGSILNEEFIAKLPKADIVYSWGVLHHTGKMWEAIEKAASLLSDKGVLYIALYTTTSKSPYWIRIKKKYNNSSTIEKRLMEAWYIIKHTFKPLLLRGKNPIRYIHEYKKNRGMAYLTNVRDWLGGYPYENAKIEEVLRFARKRLNLELINIKTGEANTEYLFIKRENLIV